VPTANSARECEANSRVEIADPVALGSAPSPQRSRPVPESVRLLLPPCLSWKLDVDAEREALRLHLLNHILPKLPDLGQAVLK
jgi:hypothetical protein